MAAVRKWRCPQPHEYEYVRAHPGVCKEHARNLELVPDEAREREPSRRYALLTPWAELVEVGSGVEIGRDTLESLVKDSQLRRRYSQISGHHARLTNVSNELMLQDLNSKNSTYLDGRELVAHEPTPIRPGQRFRLGEDVEMRLVELNEFGEPLA